MTRSQIRNALGPAVDRIFQSLDGTPASRKLARLSRELYTTLGTASKSHHSELIDRAASRLIDSHMYGEDLKRSLNEIIRLRHPRDRARLKSILIEIQTEYIPNQLRQLKALRGDLPALIKSLALRSKDKKK
jgi:hypothetical protein